MIDMLYIARETLDVNHSHKKTDTTQTAIFPNFNAKK